LARLDAGPVTGRFDEAGHFLARDERKRNPWEAAAEEADVPKADARAMHPDERLSRRRCWVWLFTDLQAVDPTQLPCQLYSHLLPSSQCPAARRLCRQLP